MPTSLHPQAKFDPIPPDLDLQTLVERTPNFEWVLRISTAQIQGLEPQEFEKLVQLQVIQGGKPLVIEKWNDALPQELFSGEWLEKTYDKNQENVRDITGQTDIPMTMGHYMRAMKQLTNQWTLGNYRDERRQRLYLKDIDCPPEWHEHLQKVIPPTLFYMNENVTQKGAADPRSSDPFSGFGSRSTVATAGDLMSSLPEEMRAQNLMCYIGHEGTFTPAHREMCASLGQNIMVEASGSENGEKPGSSIWFMTETKDREVVREYFLSMLGHDIEIEKHFAQINAWKKATFPVYIVEQKPGDFILIPPLAPHQVWNRGTRTMKVAWNRTTVETLDMALHEALPKARLVCRDEQYKNKAIIYYTLKKYYQQMVPADENAEMGILGLGSELFRSSRYKQLAKDFRHLFSLFTEVLVDEMFATKEKNIEYIEFDSCITCSYCRSNIFNRFLTCKHCVRTLINGDEDAYDVCMECYAMGRSCVCTSNLQWCEQWQWSELMDNYEHWRSMVIKNDGFVDIDLSPQPLEIARSRRGKKSLAEICQEGLRNRPFKDISKLEEEKRLTESEPEPELDDNGKPKKRKYKRKKKKGDLRRCHVCCHKDYAYKVQVCSNTDCKEGYCYGVLYRAFDMMPQTVQENENWLCPKCMGICNCGACRRAESTNPYTPKNTLLGHDTRAIADDRSVDALVDFRVHNLNWLKTAGEEGRSTNSKRMKELREKADTAKAQESAAITAEDIAHGANGPAESAVKGTNGYGDQNHVFGGEDVKMKDQNALNGDQDMSQMDHDQSAALADMIINGGWDQAAYPDPLEGQRMFGMGYYEQDGPDQILFDPFQIPSADAAVFDEEAEFLRKTPRAQKRQAKQENDFDPDFNAPKSHHRKKQKKDDAADVSSMDPALFGAALSASDSPAGEAENAESADASVAPEDETSIRLEMEVAQAGDGQRPKGGYSTPQYPANVPTLRHARPKMSYAEPEEAVADDPDLMVPAFKQKPLVQNDEPQPGDNSADPLELASDAVRALIQKGSDAANATTVETPKVPKRRGRPPKSAKATPASATRLAVVPKPSPADLAAKQREERASRRSDFGRAVAIDRASSFNPQSRDRSSEGHPDTDHDVTTAGLKAKLDCGLAAERFPQSAPAALIETETMEATAQPPKKRRGRPPKKKAAGLSVPAETQPADRSPPPPPAGATMMMSMAARVAARGGKFKITSRKSRGRSIKETPTPIQTSSKRQYRGCSEQQAEVSSVEATVRERSKEPSLDFTPPSPGATARQRESSSDHTPAPTGAVGRLWRKSNVDDEESEFAPLVAAPSSPSSSSDSGIPDASPPPPPARRGRPSSGPTVVRLGESDSESEISSSSESESGIGGPSGFPDGGSLRGRGRGRGRGQGRGRGRGRGRRQGS